MSGFDERKRRTEARNLRIAELAKDGVPIETIAQRYGLKVSTVKQLLTDQSTEQVELWERRRKAKAWWAFVRRVYRLPDD